MFLTLILPYTEQPCAVAENFNHAVVSFTTILVVQWNGNLFFSKQEEKLFVKNIF